MIRHTRDSVHYWVPAVTVSNTETKNKPFGIRVAFVGEDRLYHGLSHEADVLLLTPENWRYVLSYGQPDILLMESAWQTVTGDWHFGRQKTADLESVFIEMVQFAKKRSIPTVFWMTKGAEYHTYYSRIAGFFDQVYAAGAASHASMEKAGVKADRLLPCVQPAVYNPFRPLFDYHAIQNGILFEGWADLLENPEGFPILEEIQKFGLSIFESIAGISSRHLSDLPGLRPSVRGCLTRRNRITALKYADAYLSFDAALSSSTTRLWMTLEAAATRLPVVHTGSIDKTDIRSGFMIPRPDPGEAVMEFFRFQQDPVYKERRAHLAWRHVNQHHTVALRLDKICHALGLTSGWHPHPRVSVIAPAHDPESFSRCVDIFLHQAYPNKELIVVTNGPMPDITGPDSTGPDITGPDSTGPDSTGPEGAEPITVLSLPKEVFLDDFLDYGNTYATGRYRIQMMPDRVYGTHYVGDMVLGLQAVDVGFFSKVPGPEIADSDKPFALLTPNNTLDAQEMIDSRMVSFRRNDNRENLSVDAHFDRFCATLEEGGGHQRFAVLDQFNVAPVPGKKEGAAHGGNIVEMDQRFI